MAKVELKSTVLALDAVTGLRTDSADSVAAGTMLGGPPPRRPDHAPPSPARRHAGVAPRQAPHHPAHPESRRRRLVEAVVPAPATGLAREAPPARFGGPDPVQRRFRRRACRGIRDEPVLEGVPTDALGTVMPGSGACEARRYASGARGGEGAPGRSRGGLTTETHAAV